MIEFEKTFTQSRVDYALLSFENKTEIIIEAKPLGGNLGDKNILLNDYVCDCIRCEEYFSH